MEDQNGPQNPENSEQRDPIVRREDLYAQVCAEPMLKVAARFGVSSSYMARVCRAMNVPRPERDYWAKLAVGKQAPKPTLPDARPTDELTAGREAEAQTQACGPRGRSARAHRWREGSF